MTVLPPIPRDHVHTFRYGRSLCAISSVHITRDVWWLESSLPCHGALNRTGDIKGFASSLREGNDASYHQAARFWRWLFRGDDSPYRSMSLSGDFLYQDQQICGYIWYDMGDWSKNYLMHLLMASRIPQEYYGRLLAWEKLQAEHGLSALQAFYLIHYVSYIEDNEGGVWSLIRGESLHSPFHADYTTSFRALREAAPRDTNKVLAKEQGHYSAVNKLFVSNQREFNVLPMIKEMFQNEEKEEKVVYKGPFAAAWEWNLEYQRALRNNDKTVTELRLEALDWEAIYEH